MTSGNLKTLQTYEDNFQAYIDGTPQVTSGFQREWLEYLLSFCRQDSAILEVGSAFGRDAIFIEERGFRNFTPTDAFDAAVTFLRGHGFSAQKLNLLGDEIAGRYDLIVASAVLLHFTESELQLALVKVASALTENGLFGFSIKSGTGEEWSSDKVGAPRFFRYWTEASILPALESSGHAVVDIRHTADGKWLHITSRRASRHASEAH